MHGTYPFGGRVALLNCVVPWLTGSLRAELSAPSRLVESLYRLANHPSDVLNLVLPNRMSVAAWKEVSNKLQAFRLFATADRRLGLAKERHIDLSELIEPISRMDPYDGLWTVEGLGYYYAARRLRDGAPGILSDTNLRVPSRFLIPLHTGMGLWLANVTLQSIGADPSFELVRRALWKLTHLCEKHSREGYAGAAFEALGLLAHNVRRDLVALIDQELQVNDEIALARFWHGVGRGLYFSPTNMLPCACVIWPSVTRARREPPHELGRNNAIAGLAWAISLVNIRDPSVWELCLMGHANELKDAEPIANGVDSAMVLWCDWYPESSYLEDACSYSTPVRDTERAEPWRKYMRGYCDGLLEQLHADLKRHNRLQDVFHYGRSLDQGGY